MIHETLEFCIGYTLKPTNINKLDKGYMYKTTKQFYIIESNKFSPTLYLTNTYFTLLNLFKVFTVHS